MAVYKIFPSADATLYSDSGSQNTGLDEIIEFSTFNSTPGYSYTPQVSRALIQFANSDLNTAWRLVGASATSSVSLKIFAANVTGLSKDTTIEVHPISQSSWNMGTGKRYDDPIVTNGVSWIWSQYSGSGAWAVTGSTYYSASGSTSLTVGYYNDPDLTFDIATKNKLLKSAKWLFDDLITSKIREIAHYNIGKDLKTQKVLLEKELNRPLSKEIRLKTKINNSY